MQASTLTIVRQGDRWGVSSEGTVLALSRTKRGATELARSAARILRDSGSETEVKVAPERRSFAED
jgi:hypothetical protein